MHVSLDTFFLAPKFYFQLFFVSSQVATRIFLTFLPIFISIGDHTVGHTHNPFGGHAHSIGFRHFRRRIHPFLNDRNKRITCRNNLKYQRPEFAGPRCKFLTQLLEYSWVRKRPLVILQGVDSLLSLSWLTKKQNRDIFVKSWLRLTFSRFSNNFFLFIFPNEFSLWFPFF